MFDNVVVVYKYIGDLMFYVTGSIDENELILYTVLQAFYESVTILLRCGWPGAQRATSAGAATALAGCWAPVSARAQP